MSDLKVLLTREQIAERVRAMGEEITRDFAGRKVTFVGVLKGAAVFLSDLARCVALEGSFDFIAVSGYGNGVVHSGEVRLTKDVDESVAGKNVILVEDILDTGLTLSYLTRLLSAHQPRSLKVAVLLDKPARRIQPYRADYVGFEIPDEFVVGYGLDHAQRYRNLPDICILPVDELGASR